jgi:hypothetical protein
MFNCQLLYFDSTSLCVCGIKYGCPSTILLECRSHLLAPYGVIIGHSLFCRSCTSHICVGVGFTFFWQTFLRFMILVL